MSEKKVIKKDNYIASFSITGEAKLNDYVFKIDERSEKSAWIYNNMNLGIDVGEKNGTVYVNMMGGYSEDNAGFIYAHGKDEEGNDDFENVIQLAWVDRLNETILEELGSLCFITVGLEKTNKGKTFYKRFVSQYDAIAYIREHLEDGMVITVRGNLKYSLYNGNTQVQKNVTSIVLSKAEPEKYNARFTQTVLLNSDSASLKNIDKDKGVMYVDTRVLDYIKEVNGVEVKGQYPFNKQFEFEMDFKKPDICKKVMEKLFKVRKNVTQITFEGEFVEGGATVQATWDDVPQDIKDLVDIGIFTEEEALAKCSANGSREHRMILRKPLIRLVGEEKTAVVQKFEEKYTEDDLYLDYIFDNEDNDEDENELDDSDTESVSSSGDLDWLNAL